MSDEYIEEFNSYLAGELSAVEACDSALLKAKDAQITAALRANRTSHAKRIDALRANIFRLAGKPTEGSGPYGAISKANFATVTVERDLLALVEESEAERLVNYESQRNIVVGPVLDFLEEVLLPGQHESHLLVSAALRQIDPLSKAV